MPTFWAIVAAKMVDLYAQNDRVDVGDGKIAKVKTVDQANQLVELEMETPAGPEGGTVSQKVSLPGEVKVPLNKVKA